MNIKKFIELIPIAFHTALRYRKIINLNELYDIFNNDQLTTREKKSYLYSLQNITRRNKDTLWNAYTGDDMNDYADIPDIYYKYTVEGDEVK